MPFSKSLTKHVGAIDDIEKSYKCSLCHRSCSQKDELKRNIEIVLICCMCNHHCSYKCDLEKHA